MRIAVVGAGAAGCLFAVELKRMRPEAEVVVFEAGRRPMAKLALTGGGRCNITNTFDGVDNLSKIYPRGDRFMKRALMRFGSLDVLRWFEAEGVRFVAQPDGCVFPESQDAMQIVRTLERLMRSSGVEVICGRRAQRIVPEAESGFVLEFSDGGSETADRVLLAAGGSGGRFLRDMLPESVEIVPTVPSLYTFRIPDPALHSLMGTVVGQVVMSIAGTSFRSEGTLLVTDWGFSGPATLRLSSYAARYLSDHGFSAPLLVNWTGWSETGAREWLAETGSRNPRKRLAAVRPDGLTARLWQHLLSRAGIRAETVWAELGPKGLNRIVNAMTADQYLISGRAAFKEEFVTCGGVSLSSVNLSTLECRSVPGLYFAGEVLDIDAVTGGFNLQAAWSCAHIAAESVVRTM